MPSWVVDKYMGRKRNDRGRFADGIPPEWILEVFEDREDSARPLTASDVANALGCSRRAAHSKLEELAERGEVATRKVGARARVWWLPMTDDSEGEDQPDFRSGFGALAGSDFADQVAAVDDELDQDFQESERELLSETDDIDA